MRQDSVKLDTVLSLLLATCPFTSSALGLQVSPSHTAQQPQFYFHHTRKAGGTSMKEWFNEVCGKGDCGGQVSEGCSLSQRRFDDRFGEGSDVGITIITLREPVARAESLIKMNLRDGNESCSSGYPWTAYFGNPGNSQEICNDLTAGSALRKTLAECYSAPKDTSQCCWADSLGRCHEQQPPMWNCWANQYVKSMVGTDRKNSPESVHQWLVVDELDLELAKQRLTGFSVVLITEWFGHPKVAEYLSKHVFHASETVPLPHNREYSGDGFSGMFTSEDRALMSSSNTYDSKLYEFAKKLAQKKMTDAGYHVSMAELDEAR